MTVQVRGKDVTIPKGSRIEVRKHSVRADKTLSERYQTILSSEVFPHDEKSFTMEDGTVWSFDLFSMLLAGEEMELVVT